MVVLRFVEGVVAEEQPRRTLQVVQLLLRDCFRELMAVRLARTTAAMVRFSGGRGCSAAARVEVLQTLASVVMEAMVGLVAVEAAVVGALLAAQAAMVAMVSR
jgi:hypothetical protein